MLHARLLFLRDGLRGLTIAGEATPLSLWGCLLAVGPQ